MLKQIQYLPLAAALALAPAPAFAAQVFTGSITGQGVTAADPTCGSLPFRGTVTGATGTSPLGALTYNHSICLNGSPGISTGTFNLFIGADNLIGTMTGTATPSGTPGISNTVFNYIITGGSGAYLGASGAFTGLGTADTNFRPSRVAISFNGVINAVPEPASWALMLIGFGAMGAALRRSRSVVRVWAFA